ncbi:MAG: hypothetical protein ACI9DF_005973 [Verrucomicrobiales bacterium]|jgi:hypothetical protein
MSQFDALAIAIDAPREPHSSIDLLNSGQSARVKFTVRSEPNVLYELDQSEELKLGERSRVVRSETGTGGTLTLEYRDNRGPIILNSLLKPMSFFWLTETPLP